MTDATDMSTPVTCGELRAEIDRLERKLEHRFAQMVTKADLEAALERWGSALMAELARHARAIQEAVSTQISVVDDKYADLPGRVTRLEAMMSTRKRR